jgi:teichuronic acid biosynthesis glycosyltransferase TuaG
MDTCSVIIPCYNGSPFIAEAIQSVLDQTVPVAEIIVVDDGSTDGSASIAQGFGPPVRVIRRKNSGVSEARNCGIREAKGEWIAFLDADDLWRTDKLEKQFFKAKQSYDFVYCDAINFGACEKLASRRMDYTTLYEGNVFEHLVVRNFVTTSGVIVRRAILERTELFNPQFFLAEDWALWLSLATRIPFGCVHEPLVRYRVHPGGISKNTQKMYISSREVLSWVRGFSESWKISTRTWRLAQASIEGRRALGYDLTGYRYLAAKCYLRTLFLNPWCRYSWKSLIRSFIYMLVELV